MCALIYPAPDVGVSMSEVALSMGADALRGPGGPLPADPADDANLSSDLQALKEEAERRLSEWQTTGRGLAASSRYIVYRPRPCFCTHALIIGSMLEYLMAKVLPAQSSRLRSAPVADSSASCSQGEAHG